MNCHKCRDKGLIHDARDVTPYAATARMVTFSSYCDCDAGFAVKAREISEQNALYEQNRQAREYADSHMSEQWENDE